MTRPTGNRPRVLYLAFFFPPSRASGVYRARATANYFAEGDWDVTVLRGPQRFFEEVTGGQDETLAATVDPAVEVHCPEMDYFLWETDVRRFGRFRGNFPVLARRWYRWTRRFHFPDAYAGWGENAYEEGLRLHRERPFDLILATGNPFAAFGAAYRLGRRLGLPYIVDNRDSWTLDLFENKDAFPPRHPAWKWERKILRGASQALFVNEALRDWHAARYPEAADKMSVVLNGWDPDVLEPAAGPADTDAAADRPLSYAYVGTLTGAQPVEAMIEGFELLGEAGRHPGSTLDLYGHIGFFSKAENKLRQTIGLDDAGEAVRHHGSVSKAEVGRAYDDSDVLVFLVGGSKYVTSGKVFEYMATGKPIVSVHERGCAAEELLRGYPLWFAPPSLDPAEIAAAMAEAGDAAKKADPAVTEEARRYAASFTRYRALEPLERRARELVEGGGR